MDATAPSVLEKLSLGDTPQQEQDELTVPAPEATEAAETAPVPAGEAARRASSGDVDDAKDQLIATLTEELIATKADLARISKEREYYKRRAEWATTSDPQILSPVLTSADKWHDRTWLMLHEPIRQALLDFEDLVIKTPSFDPVKFPWKVTNFFTYLKGAFLPYLRRHHEAESAIYVPWIKTKVLDMPASVTESHDGLEKLLKQVEQSEADYKALVKVKAGPEQLFEWRSTLIQRLSAMSDALKAHLNAEEQFFPRVVPLHFTENEEAAVLQRMGSTSHAHIELPMIIFGMDVWAPSTSIRDAFLQKLSAPARYTLQSYWLPTYKKTLARALESLAMEEQPPPTYMPLMSVNTLLVAAPAFLLCSIQ